MLKVLFYGSKMEIQKPTFGGGKLNNDFGRAFYCTESIDMAKEWAVSNNHDGFVNSYSLETSGLRILKLNDEHYTILNWLAILLENRTFYVSSPLASRAREYICENFNLPYKSYDIIIGYRADDSYFSFAEDFLMGAISLEQLSRAMRLGRLGEQFVIKSEEAFNRLNFLGTEKANALEWYEKRHERDRRAREDYLDLKKNPYRSEDLYIMDILRNEIKNDDPRLQ